MRRVSYKIIIHLLLFLLWAPVSVLALESSSIQENHEQQNAEVTAEPLVEYYESGDVQVPELAGEVDNITMSDAIRVALERNLELQAATYGARASEAALRGSYGLFDPLLRISYLSGDDKRQLNSILLPTISARDEYEETSVSIQQKLPIGTELTLSGTQHRGDEVPAPTVNPYYDSRAELSLVQPLLKGFGRTVTEQQIIFSAKDQQISMQDLRDKAFQVVAEVRNAYLDALQAQYELSYRETSVELASRIVRENVARVEAGILAPVEKLEAEVGLQARERLLLDARRAFEDALDEFNLLLASEDVLYIPVIQPFSMEYQTSETDGVDSGLMKRPDVLRRMKEIEKVRVERSVARNALLPELNLVAAYGQNGLGDNSGDSLDVVRDGDYDSWEVGVNFSYPLGSIESRNELKRAESILRQQRSLLAQLHNEVRNEVRSAIRNINVSRKKTEVAKRGHELSREKLRILLKRREVGLTTTRDVLDGEEDLASARTDQIASIADYFKSITEYLRVTGTLLETENIRFKGDLDPESTHPLLQIKQ